MYIRQQYCIRLQSCVRVRETDSTEPKGTRDEQRRRTAGRAGPDQASHAHLRAAGPRSRRDGGADPRRWLILAVVALAQLMVVLDATIVNIALPDAQHALGFSDGDRQWIVTAYSLAFGSLLLLGGRLSDLIGRKRDVHHRPGRLRGAPRRSAGAAETSACWSRPARCQGAFGAMLAPAALSLLTTTFTDAKERAKAFAVFGAIAGSGGAVGLLLGGLLTQYLDWRWSLYVNVVFAVVAIAGAVVAAARASRPRPRPRLDIPGPSLVSAGLFGIVYGFSNAAADSWSAPATWGFLAAGASCWSRSSGGRRAAATRCCRCAIVARPQPRRRPTWRCSSPASACSASSCS